MTSQYFDPTESRSPSRGLSYYSPSRERSVGWGAASSPTNSIASTMMTGTSVATTGAKTEQIRTLQLELDMRDDRIRELEELYESLEQRSHFAEGSMTAKVEEQKEQVERMASKQSELDAVIASQADEIERMKKTIEEQKAMQLMMQQMMLRCQQLEEQQRLDRERAELLEAKRAAEAEQLRQQQQEEQQRKQQLELQQQQAMVAVPQQPQTQQQQRPGLNRFRNNSQQAGAQGRGCLVM